MLEFIWIRAVLCLSLLQQPHNILQKRLLEAKLSQGRIDTRGVTPNSRGEQLSCWQLSNEDEKEEGEDLIYVASKVGGIWTEYWKNAAVHSPLACLTVCHITATNCKVIYEIW